MGTGTQELLEAIIHKIPPPEGLVNAPLKALVFDSHFDTYRGAVPYIRVFQGVLEKGQQIKFMATGKVFEVNEPGVFVPEMRAVERLTAGEVGFLSASIKRVSDARVGDTVTSIKKPATQPLPGYQKVTPMVYCGLFPVNTDSFEDLRDALERFTLNDASLVYEPETSNALGFGFRCGFLGLLHMEIVQERLEREYHLELITTAPSVVYKVIRNDGEVVWVDNPSKLPPAKNLKSVAEPFARASFMVPSNYVGSIMELCEEKRGVYVNMEYLSANRVFLTYDLPLSEIIYDFFDQLKSRTRGYASLDYEIRDYRETDLVKLDILVNGEVVDALSTIIHREKAFHYGRALVHRLKKLIPRQLFEVPIQAATGNKIIARETVKAVRKNVLDKCYGGDVTRKRKLLEKQKEGKKRMKQVGNVEIPQEAFMAVLQVGGEEQ